MIITQNVDTLHEKAHSVNVVDLHGRIDECVCLQCGAVTSRSLYQTQLMRLNPDLATRLSNIDLTSALRADGDVDLSGYDHSLFTVPLCPICGTGTVKPHFVFFGDSVPLQRVEAAYAHVDKADGLLVVGTSLEVFSAYRFVLRADKLGELVVMRH